MVQYGSVKEIYLLFAQRLRKERQAGEVGEVAGEKKTYQQACWYMVY
jgi:hypothetical protein